MAREHLTEWAKREMVNAHLRGDQPFSQNSLSFIGEIGGAIEKKWEKNKTVYAVTDDFMMEVLWEIRNQRQKKQYALGESITLSNGKKVPNYPDN